MEKKTQAVGATDLHGVLVGLKFLEYGNFKLSHLAVYSISVGCCCVDSLLTQLVRVILLVLSGGSIGKRGILFLFVVKHDGVLRTQLYKG